MKIIGIIPARGGSKRLPRKNILPLAGVPLIEWTILAAVNSRVLVDTVVSTDDAEIAEVARKSGASVLSLRPFEISTDSASVISVLKHEVDQWETAHGQIIDGVLLLQPTSPFRTAITIREAVKKFKEDGGGSTVVGVSVAGTHPYWCMEVDEDGALRDLHPGGMEMRSQELPRIFEVNGSIYLVPRRHLIKTKTLYTAKRVPIIIDDLIQAVDIDTPFDWRIAQSLAMDLLKPKE